MLHRPLGQVLAFWNGLGLHIPLYHDAAHAALTKIDGQAHADGSSANDHNLGLVHALNAVHFTFSDLAIKR